MADLHALERGKSTSTALPMYLSTAMRLWLRVSSLCQQNNRSCSQYKIHETCIPKYLYFKGDFCLKYKITMCDELLEGNKPLGRPQDVGGWAVLK
jgi:hypothetical protein